MIAKTIVTTTSASPIHAITRRSPQRWLDRVMMQTETPAYVKYAGRHRAGHVPRDLDVPLLYIYSYDQYRAAIAAGQSPPQRR